MWSIRQSNSRNIDPLAPLEYPYLHEYDTYEQLSSYDSTLKSGDLLGTPNANHQALASKHKHKTSS